MQSLILQMDQIRNGKVNVNGCLNSLSKCIITENESQLKTDNGDIQFMVLSGEEICQRGECLNGTIIQTSFRLFVQFKNLTILNVPIMIIDSIECKDLFTITLLCKDGGVIRISFATNEHCMQWQTFISDSIKPPTFSKDLFAFKYKEADENCCSTNVAKNNDLKTVGLDFELEHYFADSERFKEEAHRLGFISKTRDTPWKISNCNNDFRICDSYPPQHIIPKEISDEKLKIVANFRSSYRFPSVVWRWPKNGAVILRSSQPQVGLLGWRCEEDENLLSAICRACSMDSGDPENDDDDDDDDDDNNDNLRNDENHSIKDTNGNKQKILILDLRSYASAFANRAKGGGSEYPEYYNCEIQFLNLVNIHEIRKSFCALRSCCCASPPDYPLWFSAVENSKWLQYISALIRSSIICVDAIKDGRPVLVHCSDGWDRTPQVTALAQLMMDPYYRTIDGFRYLVEREWLDFGHKFADRCGHGSKATSISERSPVFLQWLDCVFQTMNQFPTAFEFNQSFLCKLVQHTYSCLFGTFLENSVKERRVENIDEFTISIFSKLLNSSNDKVRNFLYSRTDKILKPSYHMRRLEVWKSVYLAYQDDEMTGEHIFDGQQTDCVKPVKLKRARSVDTLNNVDCVTLNQSPVGASEDRVRRLSDPNIHESSTLSSTQSVVHFDPLNDSIIAKHESSSNESCILTNNHNNMNGSILSNNGELFIKKNLLLQSSTDTIKDEQNGYFRDGRTVSTSTTDLEKSTICSHFRSFTNKTLQSSCPPTPGADSKSLSSASSSSSCRQDIDGLSTYMDPPTRRLIYMCLEQKRQMDALKQQVFCLTNQLDIKAKEVERYANIVDENCSSSNISDHCQRSYPIDISKRSEENSLLINGSFGSTVGCGSLSSNSDKSFEQINENDLCPNGHWVPDYASDNCFQCNKAFNMLTRRKHHCRNCGNIFCSNCSNQVSHVPSQQLHTPQRVCKGCYAVINRDFHVSYLESTTVES